ncbi:SAM-dependent methyltransferase [Hamadaea tsunoensis]|uniref:SAM-dependent methyltransferase n=1 Tax=Hamadaea tsunoensis TaxID=53368 RepID=UPI0004252330|nr:class I SAM-dependent methyltransferase [Hamadaea tsunoensis]
MDKKALALPRHFLIRETGQRVHNPYTPEKLATLGAAIRLNPGDRILDLCSGTGEMLCTWARDHGITGHGVDIAKDWIRLSGVRAAELDVADRVTFEHNDARGYVAAERVDVAACIGATWIGDGVTGTVRLLEQSLRPGGLMLIGEPFWRSEPPSQEAIEACHARTRDDFDTLPGLVRLFGELGYDLVEMVLADEDSWDRYAAAQWFTLRQWLDANPDDGLAPAVRQDLDREPLRHTTYRRNLLGWGVFALKAR